MGKTIKKDFAMDISKVENPVRARLLYRIRSMGMTEWQMADKLGISQPTLSIGWVGKKHQSAINLCDRVNKLCEVANCDPNTLFGWGRDESEKFASQDLSILREKTKDLILQMNKMGLNIDSAE